MHLNQQNVISRLRSLKARYSEIAQSVWKDLRGGAILAGIVPSKYKHLGAFNTENSSYAELASIFSDPIPPDSVLVDIGCGKGRVINYWLQEGLTNRIFGLELDSTIAETTRRRLAKHSNVTIISGDAIDELPVSGTIFYMHNPFDRKNVERLEKRMKEMTADKPELRIFYYNCYYVDVFDNGYWTIELKNIKYIESIARHKKLAIIRPST